MRAPRFDKTKVHRIIDDGTDRSGPFKHVMFRLIGAIRCPECFKASTAHPVGSKAIAGNQLIQGIPVLQFAQPAFKRGQPIVNRIVVVCPGHSTLSG